MVETQMARTGRIAHPECFLRQREYLPENTLLANNQRSHRIAVHPEAAPIPSTNGPHPSRAARARAAFCATIV